MFTPRSLLCQALLLAGSLAAAQSPGLGEPVDETTLAAIDYTVLPSGEGLPAGSGTAGEGESVFERHCLACHGERGTGGINDVLAGGQGSLATDQARKTVGSYWPYATTIFDYVRRAMPLTAPGSLSDDEVYAVTAYLLYVNDIVDRDEPMDAEALPRVVMPNRDGFTWGYAEK